MYTARKSKKLVHGSEPYQTTQGLWELNYLQIVLYFCTNKHRLTLLFSLDTHSFLSWGTDLHKQP